MSARVTRSKSKQQPDSAGSEQPQHSSSEVAVVKRSASGRKRKSKNDAEERKAESGPTLQLEAAADRDKQAGEQLKLVSSDEQQMQQEEADKPKEEEKKGDSSSTKDSADSEKAGDEQDGEWQDGHDDDADYHQPQSPTQLVTLQQTDHRSGDKATPALPDDLDLSVVMINRAPVLTLWAAVLAHLGPAKLPWLSALTVGKAIAAMIAQTRGRALGVLEPSQQGHKRQKTEQEKEHEADDVQVLGIKVHMADVDGHTYATISNKPVSASQCDRYIHQHFGANRPRVIAAMKYLTHCLLAKGADGEADVMGRYSFTLYEQFRPNVADGQAPGWGQKGELDLKKIVEIGKNELESAKTEGTQLHLTTEKEQKAEGENANMEEGKEQDKK